MGRKILFITTDQMRYDALGCNGGTVARTPVADGLAAAGVRFERAYCANVICTPARSTMLTGQYPRTHGAIANGVAALPLRSSARAIAASVSGRSAAIDPCGAIESRRTTWAIRSRPETVMPTPSWRQRHTAV